MLAAVHAVESVIGAHDGPGLRRLYRDFEAAQVDFAQGPIIDDGVHVHAAKLLVVHRKVLEAGANALRLNAVNQARGNLAVEQRVFREILKVPPAQWTALDVHAWPKQHTDILIDAGLAQRDAYFVHQV